MDEYTARGMRLADAYLEIKRLRGQNRRLWLALAVLLIVGTLQWVLQFLPLK